VLPAFYGLVDSDEPTFFNTLLDDFAAEHCEPHGLEVTLCRRAEIRQEDERR
jgi:hypothetical protein